MTALIAGGVILALLVGVIVWAYTQGRRGGIEATEGHLAKNTVKAEERAAEAAADAPRTPEAIDTRLRKGGGL